MKDIIQPGIAFVCIAYFTILFERFRQFARFFEGFRMLMYRLTFNVSQAEVFNSLRKLLIQLLKGFFCNLRFAFFHQGIGNADGMTENCVNSIAFTAICQTSQQIREKTVGFFQFFIAAVICNDGFYQVHIFVADWLFFQQFCGRLFA